MDKLSKYGGFGREVDAKRKRVRSADHVEDPLSEGRLHKDFFLWQHSAVVDADPVEERLLNLRHAQNRRKFSEAFALGGMNPLPLAGDQVGELHRPLL